MSEQATLLFIDDEERILRSLKMLFRGKFRVFTTTEPEEALAIAERENVHVVVSDQRMPKMLGAELLRRIRDKAPNTMRILLTGYSDLQAAIDAVNEGEIFRYLNKPWEPQDIIDTVTEAAEIALGLQNVAPGGAAATGAHPCEVLVIDDDPSTATLVRGLIGGEATVHATASLEEAFDILTRAPITVVITELRLGGQDISSALKTLKLYQPDLLAIALTSFTDTSSLIDLINHGQVYRFLPKPANKMLLERSIQATREHYRKLKASPELIKRHTVKKTEESEPPRFSSTIMGFLDKIRSQAQSRTKR